jgi:hypothetical protein
MTPFNQRSATTGPHQPADAIAKPAINRVRSGYCEMPGLALTTDQARRLFGMSARSCQQALDQLVQDGFLRNTRGVYNRTGQA